jgi:hypothetical protein
MPDYKKAVIYTISNDTDIYVGSTCNNIQRKYHHKTASKNPKNKEYNKSLYTFIRANGGWDAFTMKIIKEFPCENKIQLLIEENIHILEIGTINKQSSHNTLEDNKQKRKAQNKKRYTKLTEVERLEINKQRRLKRNTKSLVQSQV